MQHPLIVLGVIIILVLIVVYLVQTNSASKGPTSNYNPGADKSPIDYGSGVYYFPCTEQKFGMALAHFLKNHPNKRMVSMAGDDSGGYGATVGYFVVTQELI